MPEKHTAQSVVDGFRHVQAQIDGEWLPARPLPFWPSAPTRLLRRVRLAWGVFTGRYDALDWEDWGDTSEAIFTRYT